MVPSEQSFQFVNPLILNSPSFKFQTSSQANYSSTIYDIGKLTFAPRIAAAYRIGEKTVVRSGYGIFYDYIPPGPPPADLYSGNQSFAPNQVVNGKPTYQFPNPFSVNPLPVGTLSLTSFPKNVRMPYTQQWTFSARAPGNFGELGQCFPISGAQRARTTVFGNWKYPIPHTPFSQARRPLTQFGVISVVQSGATASYNGMSIQVQHRTRSGLYINTSYTWAKDLGISGQTGGILAITNPYNLRQDYGPVLWAPTHQFVTVASLPLPVGRKRRYMSSLPFLVDAIVGGWDVSSIFQIRSGDHLTPSTPVMIPAAQEF